MGSFTTILWSSNKGHSLEEDKKGKSGHFPDILENVGQVDRDWRMLCIITEKMRTKERKWDGVGVMKDKDLKLEDVKDPSHTMLIIHTIWIHRSLRSRSRHQPCGGRVAETEVSICMCERGAWGRGDVTELRKKSGRLLFLKKQTWEQEHDSGINTNVQFDKNLFSRGRQAGTQHE